MKLAINNVLKKYNERTVLDIRQLIFDSGKIYAIMGPNGSGKTTLMRILSGLDINFSGQICYNDELRLPRNEIAYLPQKPYIFNMTAIKNASLASDEAIAMETLEHLGMKGFINAPAQSLSEGESRRVAIASIMATRRKLILLDEPMAPIDMSSTKLVEGLIKSTCENFGSTIIFSTHSLQQALNIADEVLVLLDGKLAERGIPHLVFANPKNPEVKEYIQNGRV